MEDRVGNSRGFFAERIRRGGKRRFRHRQRGRLRNRCFAQVANRTALSRDFIVMRVRQDAVRGERQQGYEKQ